MEVTYSDILNLLTSTTGSAYYHLVLAISIAGVMQTAFAHKPRKVDQAYQRMVKGLLALIVIMLSSFAVLILSLALENISSMLPPLDRTFAALVTLVIVWIWAFPTKPPRADIVLWVAVTMIILAGALSALIWISSVSYDFYNGSVLDRGWMAIISLISVIGLGLVISRRPENWELGAVMLSTLVLGAVIHLFFPNEGNFPGAFRLAQTAAFPFLFSIPVRLSRADRKSEEARTTMPQRNDSIKDTMPASGSQEGVDPKLIASFLALAAEKEPEEILTRLTKTMAQSLLADLCLLFAPPSENDQFILLSGYDLIREAHIPESRISSAHLPNLLTSLERKSSLRLPANSKSPDLSTLAGTFNLSRSGGLLAHTISSNGGDPLGLLVLLSPYSQKNWDKQTESLLDSLSPHLTNLLQFKPAVEIPKEIESEPVQESPAPQVLDESMVMELERSQQLAAEQEQKIVDMEALLTAFYSNEEKFEAIQAENQLLQEQLDALEPLRSENQLLREQIAAQESQAEPHDPAEAAPSPEELQKLHDDLDQAQQLIASLRAKLEEAAEKREAVASDPGLSLPLEQAEVIASIAQDVRQPLSSITGYTDLLLGESVGILGALQKKFLERVKTSTDRMNGLIDDLVQITALDSGNIELSSEAVDLAEVFDDALANTRAQMREKNISLRVDMPNELPKLNTDRDALLQIVLHLLQNAGDASPSGGEISLHAHLEQDEQTAKPFVGIQVTDTGGGIPEEELPRVFSRLYRADNPLIEGVGDTGVGLSIAKTLTEALGGKIWVQTESGYGSTFRILLPLSQ